METRSAFSASVGIQDVTVVDFASSVESSSERRHTLAASFLSEAFLLTSVDNALSVNIVEVFFTVLASTSLVLDTPSDREVASSVFSEEESLITLSALVLSRSNALSILKSEVSLTGFAFS
jgi:hypothetical protein